MGCAEASLASAHPMSLNAEPLHPRCNILACIGPILGAAETCLYTAGSNEEVIDCVEKILESTGKGDCKACICDIIPQFCQPATHDKKIEPTEAKSLERSEAEGCNFLTCAGSILGAVETCIHTGSAEEVIDCIKNILESTGQGDCKACICNVVPQFCNDMKIESTEAKSLEGSEAEGCNFLTCAGSILGAVETCIHTGSAE